jgi:DNA-directed RNA polymerase specialized sigma subunit
VIYVNGVVLTEQQKVRLHRKMRKGDMEAKDMLARSVLPWAIKCATRRRVNGLDMSDLIELAFMATAQALNRWDPKRGKLTTTVAWAVKSEIHEARCSLSFVAKVPRRKESGDTRNDESLLKLLNPYSIHGHGSHVHEHGCRVHGCSTARDGGK